MSVLLAHNSTIVGSLPFEGLLDWLTLQDLVSYKAYQKSNEKQRVFIVVMSTLTYLFYQLWLITGASNRTENIWPASVFMQELWNFCGKNVLLKSALDIYKQDFSTTFFDSSVIAPVRVFKRLHACVSH